MVTPSYKDLRQALYDCERALSALYRIFGIDVAWPVEASDAWHAAEDVLYPD